MNYTNTVSKWKAVVSAVSAYSSKVVDEIFNDYKQAVADCVIEAAEGNDLAPYDARVYEYCEHVVEDYRRALACDVRLEQNSFANEKTDKAEAIWKGVLSVISSRVKLFEEKAGVNHRLDGNPVLREKKDIIAKSVRALNDSFDNMAMRFRFENDAGLNSVAGWVRCNEDFTFRNAFEAVYEKIEDCCFARFYEFYTSMVKFTLSNLSDLHARDEARYYYELLLEERDILATIVKIQIAALEREGGGVSYKSGVSVLKKAHKEVEGSVNGLELRVKSLELSEDEFRRVVSERAARVVEDDEPNIIYDAFDGVKELFTERLDELKTDIAVELLKKFRAASRGYVNSAVYSFNKAVFLAKATVSDVYGEFKRLAEYYSERANDISPRECSNPDKTAVIMAGIHESVKIKIESMDEQLAAFSSETDEFLKRFYEDGMNTDDAAAALCVTQQLIERFPVEANAQTLAEIIDGAEVNAEKTRLHCEKAEVALHKKITDYKKDSLLYEISTFEEILNYSVTLLRGSDNEHAVAFAEKADAAYANISVILSKHGIEVIKPKEHEMFDGKAHEVLTAEKTEGFNKGEIIKVLNCGYRQNGEVLLRANVVAAR